MADFTPYQQRMIKRYYQNRDQLAEQRLGELVSELFLAKGKKLDQLWKNAAGAMAKLGVPPSRVEHILAARDPALVAGLVKELSGKAR